MAGSQRFTSTLVAKLCLVALVALAVLAVVLGARMAQIVTELSYAQTSNMVLSQADSSKVFRATSEVPDLVSLKGMTESEALAACGRGPSLMEEEAADESGVRTCTYALTHDKVKAEDGEVRLVLSFDDEGKVVMAGFRAPFSCLGFGSLSMSEAVEEYRVLQTMLEDGGVTVNDDDLVLPEDPQSYSTYESDRVAVISQLCTFRGQCVGGGDVSWQGTLSYDYDKANETRNLAYTKRWAEIRLYF